jgi:prevent-host-death family protein
MPGLQNMVKAMKQVALSEIKDDLSKYLRLAENEEIVITKHGKPAALLVGFASAPALSVRAMAVNCSSASCKSSTISWASTSGRGSQEFVRQEHAADQLDCLRVAWAVVWKIRERGQGEREDPQRFPDQSVGQPGERVVPRPKDLD